MHLYDFIDLVDITTSQLNHCVPLEEKRSRMRRIIILSVPRDVAMDVEIDPTEWKI